MGHLHARNVFVFTADHSNIVGVWSTMFLFVHMCVRLCKVRRVWHIKMLLSVIAGINSDTIQPNVLFFHPENPSLPLLLSLQVCPFMFKRDKDRVTSYCFKAGRSFRVAARLFLLPGFLLLLLPSTLSYIITQQPFVWGEMLPLPVIRVGRRWKMFQFQVPLELG